MLAMLRGLMGEAEERDASGKPKVTLRRALDRGWLELWYQPKVNLRSQDLVGAEGLIRVRHPELGVLPPVRLPARRHRRGHAGDDRAGDRRRACATGTTAPPPAFPGQPRRQRARRRLRQAADRPHDQGTAAALAGLAGPDPRGHRGPGAQRPRTWPTRWRPSCAALNCSLAIDDFGAGYSSLARLRQLPFSELKIDRAYVTDCDTDKVNAGMLETIVELAHRFGLKTVAEGIETPHESHKLQGIGCAVGQGYLKRRARSPRRRRARIRMRSDAPCCAVTAKRARPARRQPIAPR